MAGIEYTKDYVLRVYLNSPIAPNLSEFVDYCLTKNPDRQCLAIGWRWEAKPGNEITFQEYCDAQRKYCNKYGEKFPSALNRFREATKDDLCWTRDLNRNYWICRVKSKAEPHPDKKMKIGAILPIEAYNCGPKVLNQIKEDFKRPRTDKRIYKSLVIEYSKYMFNKYSKKEYYAVNKTKINKFLKP